MKEVRVGGDVRREIEEGMGDGVREKDESEGERKRVGGREKMRVREVREGVFNQKVTLRESQV